MWTNKYQTRQEQRQLSFPVSNQDTKLSVTILKCSGVHVTRPFMNHQKLPPLLSGLKLPEWILVRNDKSQIFYIIKGQGQN